MSNQRVEDDVDLDITSRRLRQLTRRASQEKTSSGRFTLFFATGGSLTWYQDGLVDGELAKEQFSGSWSIDNQGQVSVDVPGKGRYRGQVSDTPDVLGLVASPDGSGGVNDRFIGLLLWP